MGLTACQQNPQARFHDFSKSSKKPLITGEVKNGIYTVSYKILNIPDESCSEEVAVLNSAGQLAVRFQRKTDGKSFLQAKTYGPPGNGPGEYRSTITTYDYDQPENVKHQMVVDGKRIDLSAAVQETIRRFGERCGDAGLENTTEAKRRLDVRYSGNGSPAEQYGMK